MYQIIAIAVGCVLALLFFALALMVFLNRRSKRRKAFSPNVDASIKRSNSMLGNSPRTCEISQKSHSLAVPMSQMLHGTSKKQLHARRVPASLQEISSSSEGESSMNSLHSEAPTKSDTIHIHKPWDYMHVPRTEITMSMDGNRAYEHPLQMWQEKKLLYAQVHPLPSHVTVPHLQLASLTQDPEGYMRPLALPDAGSRSPRADPSPRQHTYARVQPLSLSSTPPRVATTAQQLTLPQTTMFEGVVPASSFLGLQHRADFPTPLSVGQTTGAQASQAFIHARVHRIRQTQSMVGNEKASSPTHEKLMASMLNVSPTPPSSHTAWDLSSGEEASDQQPEPLESPPRFMQVPKLNLPIESTMHDSQYAQSSRRSISQVGISFADQNTSDPYRYSRDSNSYHPSSLNINPSNGLSAREEILRGSTSRLFYPREVHEAETSVGGSMRTSDLTSDLQLPRITPPGYADNLLNPAELERFSG